MAKLEDEDTDTISSPDLIVQRPRVGGSRTAYLVIIYGADLGRKIVLGSAALDIGRSSKNDLVIDDESVSRHHARIMRSRDSAYVVGDMGSTNGTYVNDRLVTERELNDGDQLKVGRSIMKFMTGDNIEASYHEEIYRLMTVDALTDLFNRRYFDDAIEREWSRSRRYGRPLALVLFDIDHFKRHNDEFGHVAGDVVLSRIARSVSTQLRREDIIARTGGEEFGVILPEIDGENAAAIAEKVRRIVETTVIEFDGARIRVTVSLGVADRTDDIQASTELYERADRALYSAKNSGRNRVARYTPNGEGD